MLIRDHLPCCSAAQSPQPLWTLCTFSLPSRFPRTGCPLPPSRLAYPTTVHACCDQPQPQAPPPSPTWRSPDSPNDPPFPIAAPDAWKGLPGHLPEASSCISFKPPFWNAFWHQAGFSFPVVTMLKYLSTHHGCLSPPSLSPFLSLASPLWQYSDCKPQALAHFFLLCLKHHIHRDDIILRNGRQKFKGYSFFPYVKGKS